MPKADDGRNRKRSSKASSEGKDGTGCRKLHENSNGGFERKSLNENGDAKVKRRRERSDFDQTRRIAAK